MSETQEKIKESKALETVKINDEKYFKIGHVDQMRPFFMSIVSDSNHWMFIASNGGLSAGRKNAQYALFPYYTDDKIVENHNNTGSKTIIKLLNENEKLYWEPFCDKYSDSFHIERNLYKNEYGNKIIFEEINHSLQLAFSYQWASSNLYGFVRTSQLENLGDQNQTIEILDGLQNILPYGVESDLQARSSNLVDAYKRSELDPKTGLGIFALSAIIVDRAEPSEALKANVCYGLGLDNPTHLVSSLQLENFRKGQKVQEEVDIKGEKGAYFMVKSFHLAPQTHEKWMMVANVNLDHSAILNIQESLETPEKLSALITENVQLGTENLIKLNASADGLEKTADSLNDSRHFANVLFNIMRGGIFDNHYNIEKWDFTLYLQKANKKLYESLNKELKTLNENFNLFELRNLISKVNQADFTRLATEYLPLKFSRRHGDPSRPWNVFSINTTSEKDGSKVLDYQGNWRDIFQNWEALAHSYPEFIEGMIFKFLNATTFEGYNPYRVTKDGYDWETIEPDDPWSYIGYWGDHQIIYLLKFLEFIEKHQPGKLNSYFSKDIFVYADVPYIIKPYEEILKNPKDTISFDLESDQKLRDRREEIGADGVLHTDEKQELHRVNFIEKILVTVLAKVSNFIPEGGIWLNTQRPEWNDANNALVGNGVSMVTLYYLRRFIHFWNGILENTEEEEIKLSSELVDFYKGVRGTLLDSENLLSDAISDADKKSILDRMEQVASDYRKHIYQKGFWGKKRSVSVNGLKNFCRVSLAFIDHTIKANERSDHLYESYNLMSYSDAGVEVSHLSEMLEGQVAVLSSGVLSSQEAAQILDALKSSALFREDQYSYILYPNKELPKFLEKNTFGESLLHESQLLQRLVETGNSDIVKKDHKGSYHFNGNFKNANDVKEAVAHLASEYQDAIKADKSAVLEVFEKVFNHKEFTGRSGTFFGYEGLGSIYWHMVSKLCVAVQECCLKAIEEKESPELVGKLLEHYYEIEAGIGVHKSPELYGAFPTDPYSHTPAGKGAQQPGMTGQVKEDILCRIGELGVFVHKGKLIFYPCLLRKEEFRTKPTSFEYVNIANEFKSIELETNQLAFTHCQVPVVYETAEEAEIHLYDKEGNVEKIKGYQLPEKQSTSLFQREGDITKLKVFVEQRLLK